MELAELQRALGITADRLGFRSVYPIFEGSLSTFSSTEEYVFMDVNSRRILVKSQCTTNFGMLFDGILFRAIQVDFYERMPSTEKRVAVLASDTLYGVSLACEEWFANHYVIDFPTFGEFKTEIVEKQLSTKVREKIGFDEMRRFFDEAGTPKAYRAIACYSTLDRFSSLEEGLRIGLSLDYRTVLSYLKAVGFKTSTRLPPYIKPGFIDLIESSLLSVQRDEQIRDYSEDVQEVINTILSEQNDADSSLKEFAIKSKEILGNKLRKNTLDDNNRTTVAETLERAKEWVGHLERIGEIETVEEKI